MELEVMEMPGVLGMQQTPWGRGGMTVRKSVWELGNSIFLIKK
jgi:hypothetical protein